MKKRVGIIVVCLLVLALIVFGSTSKKGTIIAFVDDAVVIAFHDGKTVTRYENYHTYIPNGEQWSIGDEVVIKHTGVFRDISISVSNPKNDDTTTEQSEIVEWVIAKLRSEISFEDNDTLTFTDAGHLISIDIKSEETAEMLFQCIRNCRSITDLTGAALAPEALPILINGKEIGRFERIYTDYPETGQFFSIIFTEEDSEAFYEYVMTLK